MTKRLILILGILVLVVEACTSISTPPPVPTATVHPTLILPTNTSPPAEPPIGTSTTTAKPSPPETQSPTPTPSFILPTETKRPTNTGLPTNTPTPKMPPTGTPTTTNTPTPIVPPTGTSTTTSTPTPTISPTGTSTTTATIGPPPSETYTPTPTPSRSPTPTFACGIHSATMMLSTSPEKLTIGDTIKITVTLNNVGCVALGMPLYRLYINLGSDEPESIFTPDSPEPVTHYLAVAPGQSDTVEFNLKATASGQATLLATASFEVHLGYPGPAYWGSSGTGSFVITVEP